MTPPAPPLKLEKFGGQESEDAVGWATRFRLTARILYMDDLPDLLEEEADIHNLILLEDHLVGEAKDWYDQLPDEDKDTFEKSTEALEKKFEHDPPSSYELSLDELADLEQGELNLATYTQDARGIYYDLEQKWRPLVVKLYIAGLNDKDLVMVIRNRFDSGDEIVELPRLNGTVELPVMLELHDVVSYIKIWKNISF
ncbi:hypothetical protein M501DRAFT_1013023 [Patellaria atrata CBS 101060]|uniref:Retrotransposon gag domain-containing protein n=1 Tax=Patellaria atrata CBS 101060 TaxID=1346257 RepID=A0A9P4SJX9_9PEZI|nr:hypothetical protein M501DRAFT_1013023 [Patellaria atrata CBS 101060]